MGEGHPREASRGGVRRDVLAGVADAQTGKDAAGGIDPGIVQLALPGVFRGRPPEAMGLQRGAGLGIGLAGKDELNAIGLGIFNNRAHALIIVGPGLTLCGGGQNLDPLFQPRNVGIVVGQAERCKADRSH